MSAFICSDSHFFAIASAIYPDNPALAQALADKLKAINIDSVNYRYKEKNPRRKCKPVQSGHALNQNDIAQLIACWNYQSCENPENLDFISYASWLNNWCKLHRAEWKLGKYWTI